MTKQCFFCRVILNPKNRSKEHKVPRWLQKYLKIDQIPINFEFISHDGIAQTRTHLLSTNAPKIFCLKCNNEWMSRSETASAPILKRLFENQLTLTQLSEKEKTTLSFWLVKTAYVFLSGTVFSSQIPKDHISDLMKNVIPDNIHVAGVPIDSSEKVGRCAQFSWQTFPALQSDPENEKISKNSYKIGLHFGNHFFLVTYFPLTNWRIALDYRYYISLTGKKDKIAWLTTSAPELEIIKNPKDGLNAYVNRVMAVSEELIVRRPTLTDLSGNVWRIV